MKITRSLVVIALAFAFSTAKAATAFPIDPTPKKVPSTVNKAVMLQLVNYVRKMGCHCGDTYYYPAPPLTWNTQLETAAYKHSVNMYEQHFFDHTAPDGTRGGDRIKQTGYNWMAYGENIAEGYKTEREVLDGWLRSPGHCKNIMSRQFKEMGVARVGNIWTQEFGRK